MPSGWLASRVLSRRDSASLVCLRVLLVLLSAKLVPVGSSLDRKPQRGFFARSAPASAETESTSLVPSPLPSSTRLVRLLHRVALVAFQCVRPTDTSSPSQAFVRSGFCCARQVCWRLQVVACGSHRVPRRLPRSRVAFCLLTSLSSELVVLAFTC